MVLEVQTSFVRKPSMLNPDTGASMLSQTACGCSLLHGATSRSLVCVSICILTTACCSRAQKVATGSSSALRSINIR